MIVISDTSVITNLMSIQHLYILPQLYHQVIIPEEVYQELVDVEDSLLRITEVLLSSWLEVRRVTNRLVIDNLQHIARLDAGESEAIALALELNADLLLIDERRGRIEANRLGLRITGLLGILVEAKSQNLIIAVKPLMDALIATSEFRVSSALYNQILDMVNEAI